MCRDAGAVVKGDANETMWIQLDISIHTAQIDSYFRQERSCECSCMFKCSCTGRQMRYRYICIKKVYSNLGREWERQAYEEAGAVEDLVG